MFLNINHLFIILAIVSQKIICETQVEYYKNLIKENVEKSKIYKAPERNIEFESGARLNSSSIEDYGVFDFIIIGAGSTGNVIATRLSEVKNWKILLLEAGGEETDFSDIPNMISHLWFSNMDWGYKTTPQKYTCGNENHRCLVPRGRVIGGTSTTIGAHYTRGNRHDFDRWAELGNTEWTFDKVLRYFKKSENSRVKGDLFYHGNGGYLNVEYSKPDSETLKIFLEAHRELGRDINVDYNGHRQLGASKIQFTTKNGRRDSTGRAFLSKARGRSNLNVTTKALVTKLIINKDSRRVKGVNFVKDSRKFRAFAKKEVILSAGAFNTPQLLMLSGIGPKKHLEAMSVDVIEDLPVGEDMFEHSAVNIAFTMNHTIKDLSLDEKIRLYLKGEGPLTKTSTVDAISFVHLNGVPKGVPMFEILFNSKDSVLNFDVLLQHPISRGSVKLKSNDPIDHPLIDSNMISVEDDIVHLVDAIQFVFELTKTKAFKKLNPVFKKATNSCDDLKEFSFDYWKCYLNHVIDIPCHAHGTTKMGISREKSVVDQNLMVFGFQNLRIADAGVIPTTMSGHILAVAVMIGEKISDVIKNVYE